MLASPAGSFMNSASLLVDGGWGIVSIMPFNQGSCHDANSPEFVRARRVNTRVQVLVFMHVLDLL